MSCNHTKNEYWDITKFKLVDNALADYEEIKIL